MTAPTPVTRADSDPLADVLRHALYAMPDPRPDTVAEYLLPAVRAYVAAACDQARAEVVAELERGGLVDPLAAHDRHVRAQALRDAADALEGLGYSYPRQWLRARADAEEAGDG